MLSLLTRPHCQGSNALTENRKKQPVTEVDIMADQSRYPAIGPEPLALTRVEVDELYDLLSTLLSALQELQIDHVMIAGSLLGAVRSESILFNDDDIDVAILDDGDSYQRLQASLPTLLNKFAARRNENDQSKVKYTYHRRPWVACDRVKSSAAPRIWIDVFVLRRYESSDDLTRIVESKEDGRDQPSDYLDAIHASMPDATYPLYHYDNRKAIELWPREYFCTNEMHPFKTLNFGPCKVPVPNQSVEVLRRFFGEDCFTHYTVVKQTSGEKPNETVWENAVPIPLSTEQYLPVQHSQKRVWPRQSTKTVELMLSNSHDEPSRDSPRATGGMTRAKSVFTMAGPINGAQEWSLPVIETESMNWFGADVRRLTQDQPEAPVFDKNLRAIMEPHMRKARIRRENSRAQIHFEVDASIASAVGVPYTSLRVERPFLFNEHTYPIHQVLAETLGVDDLSKLHEHAIQDKRALLEPLLNRADRRRFHECYDNFVTSFCIPLLHSVAITKNIFHNKTPSGSTRITYRYQAFPCIRIVRPGDVSMGPHCDTAYGHSIGSLNFHVPLTAVYGTNALYTESHPGREDWHPLTTKSVGLGYLFDGARCLHFSLENTTPLTRVSLDFRIAIYCEDDSNSDVDGGLCTREMLVDYYAKEGPGYYNEATIDIGLGHLSVPGSMVVKKKGHHLFDPDKRVGFPFSD